MLKKIVQHLAMINQRVFGGLFCFLFSGCNLTVGELQVNMMKMLTRDMFDLSLFFPVAWAFSWFPYYLIPWLIQWYFNKWSFKHDNTFQRQMFTWKSKRNIDTLQSFMSVFWFSSIFGHAILYCSRVLWILFHIYVDSSCCYCRTMNSSKSNSPPPKTPGSLFSICNEIHIC